MGTQVTPHLPMAMRVCPTPGCPNITTTGRCDTCTKTADHLRGTATQRGYTSAGHATFRTAVLARDPVCVLCHTRMATTADHYPTSRRDLTAQGNNPNNPNAGRGLCKPCHDQHTAATTPGGWHNRD